MFCVGVRLSFAMYIMCIDSIVGSFRWIVIVGCIRCFVFVCRFFGVGNGRVFVLGIWFLLCVFFDFSRPLDVLFVPDESFIVVKTNTRTISFDTKGNYSIFLVRVVN